MKRRNRNWRFRPREKASNIPTCPFIPFFLLLLFLFFFSIKKIPTIARLVLFSPREKTQFSKEFSFPSQTERVPPPSFPRNPPRNEEQSERDKGKIEKLTECCNERAISSFHDANGSITLAINKSSDGFLILGRIFPSSKRTSGKNPSGMEMDRRS